MRKTELPSTNLLRETMS